MSESDIDMDRAMQGIDDADSHVPEITWTNCADAMPPGNTCLVIRKFQGVIKRQQSWILRTCASFHPELYEWTPYTPEKWKELNK